MADGRLLRVLGTALVVGALGAPATSSASAQDWSTLNQSRRVSGERELDVTVKYGAGEFRLAPARSDVLYRLELRYDQDQFEPDLRYRNGRLHVGISGSDGSIRVKKGESGSLDLALARDLPMDLDLELGAVKADLDLGGLAITELSLATGASETVLDVSRPNPVSMGTAHLAVGAAQFEARQLGNLNAARINVDAGVGDLTLDFTGSWERNARVGVDMGIGALHLRFPRGLGVRIKKDSFLTSLDAQEMIKRGDYYYSADWESADRQLDVDVDAAFGKISVSWAR